MVKFIKYKRLRIGIGWRFDVFRLGATLDISRVSNGSWQVAIQSDLIFFGIFIGIVPRGYTDPIF